MGLSAVVIVGTGRSGRETYALLRDISFDRPNWWDFRGLLVIHKSDAAQRAAFDALVP